MGKRWENYGKMVNEKENLHFLWENHGKIMGKW